MRKLSHFNNVIAATALLLLAMAAAVPARAGITDPRPTPSPNPTFTMGVSGEGRIVPEGGIVHLAAPLGPQGPAVVSQLLVQVGDWVGDAEKVLAVLNNRPLLEAELAAAQRDAAEAAASQAQAQAAGEQAITRINLQIAEAEGRVLTLDASVRKAGVETALLLDQARREESAAKSALEAFRRLEPAIKSAAAANVATAQAQHDMIPASRAERKVAAGQLEAAKAAEQRALLDYSSQLDDLTAKAELAGLRARLAEAALVRMPMPDDPTKLAPVQAELLAARNILAAQKKLLASAGAENTAAVAFAQARLDAAEAAVVTAREQLELSEVRAPGPGRILAINTRPGEIVGELGVFDFGDTRKMYVDVQVSDYDVPRVRLGQPAIIERNPLGVRLTGTVVEISPVVASNSLTSLNPTAFNDKRVVMVKVLLDKPELVANLVNLQVTVLINPQL